jgi:WD40 repeat protein
MSTFSDPRNPVEVLAEEFLERKRRGEKPTLREYLDRHPDLSDEIRELFPALLMMEDLGDSTGATTGSLPGDGTVAVATRLQRLGDYRILREIGRGGMGVVYEAEQESLGRRVALKVLSAGSLLDSKQVRRFEREAKAAARLHHTNIVPVFGVGHQNGHHYYVMQFIAGLGLDLVLEDLRRLREAKGIQEAREEHGPPERPVARSRTCLTAAEVARSLVTCRFATNGSDPGGSTATEPFDGADATTPPPIHAEDQPAAGSSAVALLGSSEMSAVSDPDGRYYRSVARIGVQVAEALDYANRQGVLHRDIKPSNLLLDNRGNVWVADFGLAKTAEADDLTHTGDILGTIRYMAPERFQGSCDARSDVYSLGLTLYELVALRPAYLAADRHSLMERVLQEEPPRLRKLEPGLPRDLETIIAKATARDPAGRYATAGALAEDLQRFVEDRPIRARRVGLAERAWRWSRRNQGLAAMTAALVLLLLAVAIGASLSAFRFRQMARTADLNRYFSDVALAHRECMAENPGRAERLLEGCPPDLRDWEWRYLKRQSHTALMTIHAHDDHAFSVVYSPDGTRLATSSEDGTVRVFDAVTGRRKLLLPGHFPNICWLATYSSDGTMLASGGRDKTVKIWDSASGRLIHTLSAHPDTVYGLDFSPDGRLLASGSGGIVKLWDTKTWQEIRTLSGGWYVKFSPDGSLLASSGEGPIRIWTMSSLRAQPTPDARPLGPNGESLSRIAFSPDGRSIARGTDENTVMVLDVESGRPRFKPLVGHTGYIWGVAYSHDGKYLASSSADQTVIIWDADTGRLLRRFLGHTNRTTGLDFAPDSQRLASASVDGTVKIWDVANLEEPVDQEARTLPGHAGSVLGVVHGADGRFFATVHGSDIDHFATVARRQEPSRIETVTIWNAPTGLEARTIPIPDPASGTCHQVAFDADFARIAWVRSHGTVEIRDAHSGRLLLSLAGHTDFVWRVAFSPDGRRIASAGADGTLRIWDATMGALRHTLPGVRDYIYCLGFSPDSRRLALAGLDMDLLKPVVVRVWDAATGQLLPTLSESFDFGTIAFHPDNPWLARSVAADILILDIMSGRERLHLRGHTDTVMSMAFSHDGRRLASAAHDGTVKLWETATGREVLTLLHGRGDQLTGVSFSPDSRQIVSTSMSGTVKVWDATPLP